MIITDLKKKVQIFLKKTRKTKKPLLLGFSGGEDSLTLAHCLKDLGIPIHLAHFDHGWRDSSTQEALDLAQWAKNADIPFYCARSSEEKRSELAAREARYAFFLSIFKKQSFEALILAHHREDQVETILKRVLEGAHLTTLKGMTPVYNRGELPIWRPFLDVSKEAILTYIKAHRLNPIQDSTNLDPQYLRARMRKNMIPHLSEEFGKAISSSLLRTGQYASELEEYLEIQTRGLQPVAGPFGLMWDFSFSHPLEIRYVLGNFFRKEGATPSESVFKRVLSAIQANLANHRVCFSHRCAVVDRKRLFLLKMPLPKFSEEGPLKEGEIQQGQWEWKVALFQRNSSNKHNWQDWWKGKVSLVIPQGNYQMSLPNRKGRKRQNYYQVPAFLRDTLPILMREKEIIGEFLIDSMLEKPPKSPLLVQIEIKARG